MNRKLFVSILISIAFLLLIVSVLLYAKNMHAARQIDPLELESMQKAEIIQYIYDHQEPRFLPVYYVIPIIAFFALAVGAAVYHIMMGDVERKEESIKHNSAIILKFLSGEERKFVQALVDNNGKIRQYELSHLPNLNKVQTHRILLKLEQKGIIRKEKIGKVNNIVLSEELYGFLKK